MNFSPELTSTESPPLDLHSCNRLDAFTRALQTIFVEGVPANEHFVAQLRDGVETAHQLALGCNAGEAGTGAWTACWCRPSQGGCSLTLKRRQSPQQELLFTQDSLGNLYGGFGWEAEGSGYFFVLRSAGAGWDLQLATSEEHPSVSLGGSLPWTLDPTRGWSEKSESPETNLFGDLVAATLALVSQPAARLCPHCHQALASEAKFCGHCGVSVRAGPSVCLACQQILEPGSKFCGKCGTRCASN